MFLVFGELDKDIENFRLTIEKNHEQLQKFSKILKATKIEYQKIYKENNELKNYILNQQKQQQQQQYYSKLSDYRNKEVYDEENTVQNDEDITPTNSDNEIEETMSNNSILKKQTKKTGQKRTLIIFDCLNNGS